MDNKILISMIKIYFTIVVHLIMMILFFLILCVYYIIYHRCGYNQG